jgi:hypothetical protein
MAIDDTLAGEMKGGAIDGVTKSDIIGPKDSD